MIFSQTSLSPCVCQCTSFRSGHKSLGDEIYFSHSLQIYCGQSGASAVYIYLKKYLKKNTIQHSILGRTDSKAV